jgi:hypothetical protein
MDTTWAAEQLRIFLRLTQDATSSDIVQVLRGQELIVHKIADVVWPDWRSWKFPNYRNWWSRTLDLAQRCLMLIERQEEIERNLGDVGPKLAAAALHPWVWEAARSLWSSAHYAQAVTGAATSVNGFLQKKVNRRDVSEAELVVECFSLDSPKPGRPRLRLMEDDGSKTFRSVHQGALAFGQGCYLAMRNPLSHEADLLEELPENEALEQLAAFSLLARWIEQSFILKSSEE